jgi:hypothetical protein
MMATDQTPNYGCETIRSAKISDLARWCQKEKELTYTFTLGSFIHAIPASKSASERSVSIAGHVIHGRSNCFKPGKTGLIFLNSELPKYKNKLCIKYSILY